MSKVTVSTTLTKTQLKAMCVAPWDVEGTSREDRRRIAFEAALVFAGDRSFSQEKYDNFIKKLNKRAEAKNRVKR